MLCICFWKPWPRVVKSFKDNICKKIIPPFINLTIDETLEKLQNHIFMLRKNICSSDGYIAFKVGFDANVVVQSWKILESYG